ncbi:MAG: hypothetical protein OEL20_04890 [Sulfuritalea sp.]|nr:hypothetical protein [Sulfuritalea sp.]
MARPQACPPDGAQSTITLHIGDDGCHRLDDTPSTRQFKSLDAAIAYMWALAHATHKEAIWMPNGNGKWVSNLPMRHKPIPSQYRAAALKYAEESDAIYDIANAALGVTRH